MATRSTSETFQSSGEKLITFDLGEPERKNLADRLSKMIDYGIKRQDWYEDQRNKILALGLALLGLSSFLVGDLLSPAAKETPCFRALATCALLAIAFTSIRLIHIYARGGSHEYTHRKLADIRSWYHAYVVSRDVEEAAIVTPGRDATDRETLLTAWEEFLAGWSQYQSRPNAFVVEDLQQVFVLYLFQAIRRRNLREMIEAASQGGYVIGIFLVFAIVFAGFRI